MLFFMKKFMILFIFLFLLLFTYNFKPVFLEVFSIQNLVFSGGEYSIYCLNIPSEMNNCDVVKNGNSYVIKTDINYAKEIKSKVSFVMGESVRFKGLVSGIDKIIGFFKMKVLKTEKLDNIICVYGFSEILDFDKAVEIDNEKINIQIAFCENTITVGTPIILGDY